MAVPCEDWNGVQTERGPGKLGGWVYRGGRTTSKLEDTDAKKCSSGGLSLEGTPSLGLDHLFLPKI